MCARTSSMSPRGRRRLFSWYDEQTSVVIVNPGGTGRPMRVIAARFAPLPPSRSFIDPSPSVETPNAYTSRAATAPCFLTPFLDTFFATLRRRRAAPV